MVIGAIFRKTGPSMKTQEDQISYDDHMNFVTLSDTHTLNFIIILMNKEDKLRHIENVEKAMTSYCFQNCFNRKKYIMDFDCVSTCYHKYLFSIKTIYEAVETQGRE